ncbi:methionyl-tRNA formyltransferase [Salegentibacter sp. LM13S]|uniref:formyltransferase family protein n=1 Tax=Salegentibacter lacus TaxID=2873599 RepID=UPI001CCF8378|nr:formyltransferase family protein [Salegentibacter lacus]MBZ9631491.1 methionyl-tRNA formyltransferase [Salegentibacter lacus]
MNNQKTYLIVTEKKWHKELFHSLIEYFDTENWLLIDKRKDFTKVMLDKINPHKIFIPHWSYIIPSTIFKNFECIVFHMTDLPYGRGGSPLQNLIVNGHTDTKISALKVEAGLDTGPIYLKRPLSLYGTAQEIFLRSKDIVEEMIIEIVEKGLSPVSQEGKVVEFKRRKPNEGNVDSLKDISQIFDHIRMLDCEGYPPAFIETEEFRFEFTRASLKSEKEIIADVRIIKK